MLIRRLSIIGLFLLSTAAAADPAPWYWWVSQVDGSRVCSQISLGEGWLPEPTPFQDARCRVRLHPR